MSDTELWQERLAREKAARQAAESLLEQEILNRREVERQLLLSRDEARQNAELKSRFLAHLRQEIHTSLHAIIGLTDELLDTGLSDDQLKQLNIVKHSSRLLLKVVDDVLALSMLDANEIMLEYRAVSLTQLLDQSVALIANSAAEKNLRIRIYLDQDTPDAIIADKMRLQQVLLNLLSNAVNYADSGTIKLWATLDWAAETNQAIPAELQALQAKQATESHRLQITVEDQGLGITSDDQQLIFDPFSQLQEAARGGPGLGLSICRRLARLMGGDIAVESSLGRGSRFTVSLPCLLPGESQTTASGPGISPSGSRDSGQIPVTPGPGSAVSARSAAASLFRQGRDKPLSILIADDSEINRIVNQAQLEELGYRADLVTNGEEVLRALKARHYDVLLLDIQMPVLDGIETSKRIRQLGSDRQPYIIAVTASARPEDRQRFKAAGIDDHLAKPVTLEVLAASLKSAFDREKGQPASVSAATEKQRIESDVLQLEDLRSRLGGSADELLSRVIPVFLREMPGRARAIREAHANKDPVSFARLCHSLKGSCHSVGAGSLAAKCEILEQQSYKRKLPGPAELETFLSLSDATVQALSNELKNLESH